MTHDSVAAAPVRVLIADDEAMVRAGVRSILETDAAIEVVAEAGDGREAVELARRHRPGVALLDIRMPVLDGLEAARQITILVPETRVLVLTTFGDDAHVERALTSGAAGFLLKASDPRELITGVHAVADGAAYLSPRIAQRVIAHYRDGSRGDRAQAQLRIDLLSGRELDVLALLGTGLSNHQIARRLHLVEGTVKGHVSAILTKLDAHNRVQAAVLAHRAGLAPVADHR
ncbi:response regulator [Kineococcus esterisolvens]|uniref:response regulator n=1 Tax=unclassified Kineococcus TaxID=2621656 RepID=UPI003D7E7F34